MRGLRVENFFDLLPCLNDVDVGKNSCVATKSIVEPFQAIKSSRNFRDRIVIDGVEVFWRDITQPVGNDDIAQVDDCAAFLFCHN